MNNLLVAIAVFFITVVGALFAVPYFVDWNSYRSNFEEEASRIVGREVQVDGDVTLHLLPTPYFRLEKVRIADAKAELTFFRADSLSIKLSIPPMFRGIVEANEIEFQRPIVRLALDAKDTWNWQSFAQVLGSGGYLPANVTLTSLKIADGVLALHGPDGNERARLEGLNGELSAPALEGPYRFRGTFLSSGAEREVRIATAAPEADGSVRFRASLRLADTGATYLLDARALDLMGKSRIEGELTARLPIAGLWQPLPQGGTPARRNASADEEHKLDKNEAAFDLKAGVKADVAGAELTDLSLTFEQDNRPQIVTGSMRADWRNELTLDMTIASRWLDLDRITGANEQTGPIDSIAKFSSRLRDLIPGHGKAQVTLAIDQASLGHDAIGPIQLLLNRSDDKLDIKQLRVGLPGASRGELEGAIFDAAGKPVVFEGRLALRGTSMVRFLTWSTGNAFPVDAKADGAFSLRAQIAAGNGKVAARDLVGDLSGSTLSGSAQYRWDGRPELTLELQSPRLDARAFIPPDANLPDMQDLILRGLGSVEGATTATGQRGLPMDVLLRVNAGQISTLARTYRDVAVSVEVKSGQIKQLQVRLAGDEGYKLELDGAVENTSPRPRGRLRSLAVANTVAGVAPLTVLLGVPQELVPASNRAQAMVPLRIAGSTTFGARTATSIDIAADGEANGATVKLDARFDGGKDGWRSGRAVITANAESPEAKIFATLLPGATAAATGPGRVLITATGVPSEGLSTLATFDAGDAAFNYRGRVILAEAGNKVAGDLEFRAGDSAPLLALAGLPPPLKLDGVPISGKLNLILDDSAVGIDMLSASIGGRRLSGRIKLTQAAGERRIDASFDTDEMSIAKLLAPLLDQRLAITGAAEAAISGRQSIWPDEPFSAAVFDALKGTIRFESRRLVVAEGITLEDAKLGIALDAGKIEIEDLSGKGLGGQFKANLQFTKAPAGAELRGTLTFGAALEAFTTGTPPRASGPLNGTLEFTSRGLSPRGLMQTLQGQGKIEFGEAKLDTLWPGAIPLAVDAAVKAEPDKLSTVIRRGLASGLSTGNLPLGNRTVALELADGQLRVKSFAVDTREGRATGIASLDLRALTFDSLWRLEAKAGISGAEGKQLPPVTVVYSGPAASLGTTEPRIDSSALEQELSARKIERDVEELERLRRLDEQRRQSESERLRRQFEQPPPPQRGLPPSVVPLPPPTRDQRPASPG